MMRWMAFLGWLLGSLAIAAEPPTATSAAPVYVFDLPAAPLPEALRALYRQTGTLASVWVDASPDAIVTGRVKGTHTLDAAMQLMLAPTELTHRITNARSVVILDRPAAERANDSSSIEFDWPAQSVTEALITFSAQTNLQIASDVPEGVGNTIVPPFKGRRSLSAAADHIVRARKDGQLRWMWTGRDAMRFYCESPRESRLSSHRAAAVVRSEELLVTGSRLPLTTGVTLPAFAPLQIFESRDIEALNLGADGNLLKYTPQQPYQRAEFFLYGEDYAELRGFGWDTTLVLLDGQRTFPSSVARNSVDLNHVPAALIERIEVLSDTASAAYGGEAMGGVVNLVLKRQFPSPHVEIEYGGMDGGARSRRASLGLSLPTQRSMTTVFLESLDEDMLLGASRRLWRDQDFRRFGGVDYRSPAANPGTVYSVTGANLPGLTSPMAAIPSATAGDTLSIDDFVETQGLRNVTSLSRYYMVAPERSRHTGFLSSKHTLDEDASLTAELLVVDAERRLQSEPVALLGAFVPAQNPFNPFGEDVRVDYLLTGAGPEERTLRTRWARAGLSLAQQRGDWSWTASLSASDERTHTQTQRANAGRAMAALAQSDAARALNPFGTGPGGSEALLASLRDTFLDRQRSRGQQLSVRLRGPLPGSIQTTLGAQWRHEAVFLDTPSGSANTRADRGRDVSSMFAEFEIPVLARPSGTQMSVVLSGRLDHYSDVPLSFNPNIAVVWSPVPNFLVRAAYGESTRPASLFEMYTPPLTIPNVPVRDPRRGNQLTPVAFVSGGNPDLEPATSHSFITSLLWQPADRPLRVLATYWDTEVKNRVAIVSFFQLLSVEATFSERVERAAPSSSDLAAGYPGALVKLDGSRMTGGSIQTRGIDLQAQYRARTPYGAVPMSLNATWTHRFRYRNLPGTPASEAVGLARSVYGTIPRWRLIATLGWEVSALKLTGVASWIPAYDDTDPFGTRIGRQIGDRVLLDAQATFNLEAMSRFAGSEGLRLSVGAKNLLNQMPEPAQVGAVYGFDMSQFDLTGRQWYVKLTKDF